MRCQLEKQWKEKREYLIRQGYIDDPIVWVRAGQTVINDLDNDVYQNEIDELRFVEIFSS